MTVKIRLTRMGTKKRPFYRIVVANSKSPRDGAFIEILGTYDPLQSPAKIQIKDNLLKQWIKQGAKATNTVSTLLKSHKLWPKIHTSSNI